MNGGRQYDIVTSIVLRYQYKLIIYVTFFVKRYYDKSPIINRQLGMIIMDNTAW